MIETSCYLGGKTLKVNERPNLLLQRCQGVGNIHVARIHLWQWQTLLNDLNPPQEFPQTVHYPAQ